MKRWLQVRQMCRVSDNPTFAGNYKVQLFDPTSRGYADYPGIGMHVEVKDPDDKVRGAFHPQRTNTAAARLQVILSKLYTSEGKFTFTSHTPRRACHLFVFEHDRMVFGRTIGECARVRAHAHNN